MKRLLTRLLLLATVCYLVVPAAVASAHPLGNFTINRFARVEVAGDRLYVRYVVDMAEIPTLQRVPIRIGGLGITVERPPRAADRRAHRARPSAWGGRPPHDAVPGDSRRPPRPAPFDASR